MYEFADVISNNFYPGWYNGPASGINKTWSDTAAWVAANHPDKPFIISETGALTNLSQPKSTLATLADHGAGAGGIVDAGVSPGSQHRVPAGPNASAPARWSLEYQRIVDDDAAKVAMTDDFIAGLALWQFCDIKVDQPNGTISSRRPGGINNKGASNVVRAACSLFLQSHTSLHRGCGPVAEPETRRSGSHSGVQKGKQLTKLDNQIVNHRLCIYASAA
jgi:hypothetical protein